MFVAMVTASFMPAFVIISASRGALEYSNFTYLKHLMLAAVEENPDIPIAMHLDHGNSLETCKEAIALGFTSVMIDGSLKEDSKTPTTYEENLEVTLSVIDYARPLGVTVEAELGTLGGIEDGVGSGRINLTDPDQAVEFVEKTKVDALAIAICHCQRLQFVVDFLVSFVDLLDARGYLLHAGVQVVGVFARPFFRANLPGAFVALVFEVVAFLYVRQQLPVEIEQMVDIDVYVF